MQRRTDADRPLPVDAPVARKRRQSSSARRPCRTTPSRISACTWTHILSNVAGGRVPLRPRRPLDERQHHAGNDTPIIRFAVRRSRGTIIGNAGQFPIIRDQTDHQFVYNLTAQLLNNHSLTRRHRHPPAGARRRRGQLLARFLELQRVPAPATPTRRRTRPSSTAASTSFQKGYGPFFLENRINESNVYVQDDWRLTDTLTLNLGLRYEYVAAPTEKEGRIDYVFGADNEQHRAANRRRLRAELGDRIPRQAQWRSRTASPSTPATASTMAASSSRSSRRAAPTSASIRPTRCSATSTTTCNNPAS